MDESTRRAWSRPELIVLVRSKAEEAVLTSCKNLEAPVGDPAFGDGSCGLESNECGPCSENGGS